MNVRLMAASVALLVVQGGIASDRPYPRAMVSFEDFKSIVAEVEPHRAGRLVNLDTFLKMSREPGTMVLDTRSTMRYERIHLKGARHLSFTDFTQADLAKVIPSFDTRILIYCNNNFVGNPANMPTKVADPRSEQFGAERKPLMMALNIPTYVNLYGYGYRNVYELDELVRVRDPRVTFEGSTVERAAVGSLRQRAGEGRGETQ